MLGGRSFPKPSGIVVLMFVCAALSITCFWFGFYVLRYNRAMTQHNYEYARTFFIADLAIINYNEAWKHTKFQNLPRAIELYREAFRHAENPELKSDIRYNIGVLLERLENTEGAVKEYKEALRLNPNNREARFNLERLYHFVLKQEDGDNKASLELAPGADRSDDQRSRGEGQGRGQHSGDPI
jgi:Ca-activated chloride channel homolog